jgi:hypothetical protein
MIMSMLVLMLTTNFTIRVGIPCCPITTTSSSSSSSVASIVIVYYVGMMMATTTIVILHLCCVVELHDCGGSGGGGGGARTGCYTSTIVSPRPLEAVSSALFDNAWPHSRLDVDDVDDVDTADNDDAFRDARVGLPCRRETRTVPFCRCISKSLYYQVFMISTIL